MSDFVSIWMGDLKGKVGVLHEVVLVIHSVILMSKSPYMLWEIVLWEVVTFQRRCKNKILT